MEQQYVIFNLGNEHYGVSITAVDRIIKMQEITKVPQAFDFVEGITSLRGEVLPVIDLGRRLGLRACAETHETRIVIVYLDGAIAGMIVDAVSEVATIPAEDIEPTPTIVSTTSREFIRGVAVLGDRLVVLLDLRRVFSSEEIEALPVM